VDLGGLRPGDRDATRWNARRPDRESRPDQAEFGRSPGVLDAGEHEVGRLPADLVVGEPVELSVPEQDVQA